MRLERRGKWGKCGGGGRERVCLMNARTCRLLLTEIIQLVGDIIHARLGQLPTPPHTHRDTNKIARKDNRNKKNTVNLQLFMIFPAFSFKMWCVKKIINITRLHRTIRFIIKLTNLDSEKSRQLTIVICNYKNFVFLYCFITYNMKDRKHKKTKEENTVSCRRKA